MSVEGAIFVINLKYRTDRRAEMLRQLSGVGWAAEFFTAISPDSVGDFKSVGARGCFLSHLGVLRKAHDAGAKQLVILEDDLNFASEFAKRWACSISKLEQLEWSIFYAGHKLDDLPAGLSRILPTTSVQCAHFMVINGRAIPALISGLESILSRPAGHPLGGPMHVDGAYSTIRAQNPALATYAYSPTLGSQRPSRTDIGDTKWFDRVALLVLP